MEFWSRADPRLALAVVSLLLWASICSPLLMSVSGAASTAGGAAAWQLWWPSVALAAVAATLSTGCALLGHWALVAQSRHVLLWMLCAIAAACALPSYIHALAWSWTIPSFLAAHRRLGAEWTLGLSYAPVAFLVLAAAFKALPRNSVEAAWTAGLSPVRTFLLRAHAVSPALLAAWLSAFLLSFSDFPVADYFQTATYATEVFARVAAWMNPASATQLALPILATAVVTVVPLTRLFAQTDLGGAYSSPAREPRHAGKFAALPRWGAAVVFIALVVVTPLAALTAKVSSLDVVGAAWRSLSPDFVRTALLGGAVGIVASTLSGALAYVGVRRLARGAWLARLAAWIALGWPASLLCLSALSMLSAAGAAARSFEWLAIGAVLTLRWLVLPLEMWWTFFTRLRVSQEEACWLAGLSWWRSMAVLLRPHGPAVFAAAALLTFCFSVNDLTTLVLLAPPGFGTTTLNIFSAVHYGPDSYLAALCLLQVGSVAFLALIAVALLRTGAGGAYAYAAR